MLGIFINEINEKTNQIYSRAWLFYQAKYFIDGVKLMDKAILYLFSQIAYATCSFDWDIISGCFFEDSSEIFVLDKHYR